MIKLQHQTKLSCLPISQASFPSPFPSGLEYGAPARGPWNIVHTGMLIPNAHQIFVCAESCLRGVVLTAAEMHAAERFSTICIRENNLLDGDMEALIIDGVSDILHKLNYQPRAILLYTSCIHHFIGCDLNLVYQTLRERFPEIDFTDCYMNPIMRKSMLTPDQLMRRQLYSLLKEVPKDNRSINIIGNNLATDSSSEVCKLIQDSGFTLREITSCHTYEEYQQLAQSIANITYNPAAKAGGEDLANRLHQTHLYLPLSYNYDEIKANLTKLSDFLHTEEIDYPLWIDKCEEALQHLKTVLQDTPIAIDYTATMRPLGLARLLIMHDLNVQSIYIDSFSPEEQEDLAWLKTNTSNLMLYATVHAEMRFLRQEGENIVVAIGQKAAYFTQTRHFVNMIEGGGLYGFEGICKLCCWIEDAFIHEKNTRELIQIKGLGCDCI